MTTVPGTPAPAAPAAPATRRADAGVGASVLRPDGTLKVTGEFAFSSDMWMADMLWGATLRSPHPRARIRSMDITGALRLPGVAAVLTADDVPGRKTFGLEAADQPVLADGQIRYQGEPLVIIAADHPETARRAAAAVTVDYEVLTPVTDAEAALRPGAEPVHTGGNLVRHVRIRRGDPQPAAGIVVSGRYQVGMQDQAFLGPESGLAVPAEDGGIELYVATQWLHVDQAQIAVSLGMPEDKVRLVLAGVGGAFGAREDLSMQIHACLLALHTGRPVKMVYSREESFFGHVHRHPATLYYEHGITPEGRLVSRPGARLPRWRGVHVEFSRGGGERGDTRRRALRGAQRGDRRVRRLHEQPAVRGDARFRRRPGGLRLRVPDGRVRPPAGPGPGRVPDPQRDVGGLGDADRAGRGLRGPGRRTAPPGRDRAAAACPPVRRRPGPAGRPDLRELPGGVSNTTHGEGVRPRRRVRRRHQERGLLRGVRRLLHGPGPA